MRGKRGLGEEDEGLRGCEGLEGTGGGRRGAVRG